MNLQRLKASHFRTIIDGEFNLESPVTFILGENAHGKTNLLEAVYFVIMGEGFRDSREEQLITFGSQDAVVRADFKEKETTTHFQIFLKRTTNSAIEKIYTVNKTKKNHHQYLALSTRAVLFSPDQILIMIGSPEIRRSYFDRVISSFDAEYRKRLINYENALRRRNKILEHHLKVESLKEELSFWDVYLAEQAAYLVQGRQGYIDFLNRNPKVEQKEFTIEYRKNELTVDRLEERFEEERRYRKTLIGPQKDEYVISQKESGGEKNLHHFGSRSEQRLAIYWLKLNEARTYEERSGIRPILLLDDIFSELDAHNKRLTLKTIHTYQTILTTTEHETVDLVKDDKNVLSL